MLFYASESRISKAQNRLRSVSFGLKNRPETWSMKSEQRFVLEEAAPFGKEGIHKYLVSNDSFDAQKYLAAGWLLKWQKWVLPTQTEKIYRNMKKNWKMREFMLVFHMSSKLQFGKSQCQRSGGLVLWGGHWSGSNGLPALQRSGLMDEI